MRIKKPFFFALGMAMFAILITNLIKGDDLFVIFMNMMAVICNFFLSFSD